MKLTSQPQRWAIVPAAVMAVTGLGLIIVAPGNSVLTDAGWTARIAPAVASTTRVCAYHRAGQRWSDDLARLQDGVAIARDLHALRAAAASLASWGIDLLVPEKVMSSLPSPAATQVRAFGTSLRGLRNMRDEVSELPAVFAQAGALHTLGRKPLALVTATESLRDTAAWSAAQDRLAALSSNSSDWVIDATHAGLLDDERASSAAALAITEVVHAVRTGGALGAH